VLTGSLTADKRAAIVEYFKETATIMIATEAAAEGEAKKMLNLEAKVKAQREIKDLEKKRREKRQHLFEAQDTIDTRKDSLLDEIEKRLNQEIKETELFTIKWKMI